MRSYKILFCKWNNICEIGVSRALKKLGHEVVDLIHGFSSVDYDKEYLEILAGHLMNTHFDFVLSMNYMPIISRGCEHFHIPYISWTTDSPVFQLYSNTVHNTCNYIFCFDYNQYLKFRNENPEHIFYMPLGFDRYVSESLKIKEEEKEMFSCDVSFIGSTYAGKSGYDNIKGMSEYLKGYCNALIEVQKNIYGDFFLERVLTEEICKEFKKYAAWIPLKSDYIEDKIGIIANSYLGLKCTELDRLETLRNVSTHFATHLYTQDDTARIPNIINKGPADSQSMMPKIFNCSKINLNMTSRTIQTGIPQRIFDIMGVGGFVLTNYQSEIPEYFEIGRELEVYESQQDLIEKIDYYLKHEKNRCEIAKNGEKKVNHMHTYENRLKEIFSIVMEM